MVIRREDTVTDIQTVIVIEVDIEVTAAESRQMKDAVMVGGCAVDHGRNTNILIVHIVCVGTNRNSLHGIGRLKVRRIESDDTPVRTIACTADDIHRRHIVTWVKTSQLGTVA